ncbi:MAG: amidohydrolase [Candidatus Heimdallarchaeota archaeon]
MNFKDRQIDEFIKTDITDVKQGKKSILIKNGLLLTMDDNQTVINDVYVFIENGLIIEIGNIKDAPKADDVIDAENGFILPGFVNAHTHVPQTLFRGIGNDKALYDWLSNHIWPMEGVMTPDDCLIGSLLTFVEMIKTGTTTFAEMYFHEDKVIKATLKSGIRGVIGYGMVDFNDEKKRIKELSLTRELLETYYKIHDRITFSVAPHAPTTCSSELLKEASKIATNYDLLTHIHVAETENEINSIKKDYNKTPIEYLNDLGILNPKTLAIHMVHLTKNDLEISKKQDIKIVHCPQSNLKLASGFMHLDKMFARNLTVGLGTDSASSNNSLDMVREMKTMAILHKALTKDASFIPASKALNIATKGGAKCLNLHDKIGSIEVGKRADIIIMDCNKSHVQPMHDPYTMIVYSMTGFDVKDTIVDGNILMKNRKLLTLNEEAIIGKVKTSITNLKNKRIEKKRSLDSSE